MQLAGLSCMLPGTSGQGSYFQGGRHVVARLRLRHAGPGTRRSKHVLHPHRLVLRHAGADRGPVHLERYDP